MNHTIILLAVKNYLKAAEKRFVVCDEAVDRRVYSMWGIAKYCTPRNRNYNWAWKNIYLKCICGNINAIYSGQYHTKCEENRECKIFYVNTQYAGG